MPGLTTRSRPHPPRTSRKGHHRGRCRLAAPAGPVSECKPVADWLRAQDARGRCLVAERLVVWGESRGLFGKQGVWVGFRSKVAEDRRQSPRFTARSHKRFTGKVDMLPVARRHVIKWRQHVELVVGVPEI